MSVVVVQPSRTVRKPFDARQVQLVDGFWADRVRINRERTIPHGLDQLRRAGNLENLRLAAGGAGAYRGDLPFLDSDVYKWLEAVGWSADDDLAAAADEVIALVAAAQRGDGYLNSYVQVVGGGVPYRDLSWGHELYSAGHLIQAAVAWHRARGDDRLLTIAVRAAEHLLTESLVDGHPGVEMALVELTRVTGDRRYLTRAAAMLDMRGHGRLRGAERFGPTYWQDHEPVRDAASVAGHAVRQLYLDCGAVDVAVELGDDQLLAAVRRRWNDLMHTRTYLTGGMGSRHRDEAFGDPYELPPDRAYAETCAAIASVMLAWRLLLATGEAGYADAIERTLYNGVLSGVSLDGTRFFYTNPLQLRTRRAPGGTAGRRPWYACACCPPNLMRLLGSWQQYLATYDDTGIQLHQYASADVIAGPIRLRIRTAYPWDGRVTVHIEQTPPQPWTLSLRVPRWCHSATLTEPDGTLAAPAGTVKRHRRWQPGEVAELSLDMPPRITEPDPRVDAIRGCVAVERGPLVYCVESADAPEGMEIEELTWDRHRAFATVPGPEMVGIAVPVARGGTAGAIPYFAWANRGVGGMRVWIPR
ncbi:glycoside hydrolase family 127 protein [Actinoplanes sp. TBRC 11911]|uniref:glycoside hydrolase family 127 protein n=1 Tax=Actinoplanes sp. TBRC 11911 TaxID=2729386 RepID=UPI00145E395E|nr:beta-L-arabinofuranosidase domain-containing protein [Actinoplanes sp. TBRC 11911]NMO54609.1 glycoside hydrolase family 127 protein [Actinoplanes sp. TBRC 11911]